MNKDGSLGQIRLERLQLLFPLSFSVKYTLPKFMMFSFSVKWSVKLNYKVVFSNFFQTMALAPFLSPVEKQNFQNEIKPSMSPSSVLASLDADRFHRIHVPADVDLIINRPNSPVFYRS